MSSTTPTSNQPSKFPKITLDTTLADLLAEEPWSIQNQALCNIKPCADPRHNAVPLNKKYLITSAQASDENDLAHLQLENVSYLLSFWAGPQEISLMGCEGWSDDGTLTVEMIERNAQKVFEVLDEKQRPRPKTFSNKQDFIQHCQNSNTPTRWGFAVDFAEEIPCYIHPEVQYRLNSKRWLAECSLRSAHDRIIDPECSCDQHTTETGLWYYGFECDRCKNTVKNELSRLKTLLINTKPPFVLKVVQSLGSVGTMLAKDEGDRDETVNHILQVQEECLPRVTAENAHIHPASLVLSDFLPGDTNATNFYVRGDGSVRFLGACQQLSTRTTGGGHQHTALTWDKQDKLEQKFRTTLDRIGKVLHEEGYYGPCGADIMETEDGTQYVIDLNVRTSTSTILGCLRGHCQKRKFNVCAVYECLLLDLSRDDLEERFGKEFEDGRLILLGNTRLGQKDVWAYPVVIAAEDMDAIENLSERLLEFEAKGGKDAEDAGGA